HAVEDAWITDWILKHEDYKAALAEYEARMKAWRGAREGSQPVKPTPPPKKRLLADDFTIEALAAMLADNPRGSTAKRAERRAWICSMNQYREGGRGADRQFWLSAWSGASLTVDRKKSYDQGPPLRVRSPFVGVVGGVVPDNLSVLKGGGRRG